jgi:hypothetical protein
MPTNHAESGDTAQRDHHDDGGRDDESGPVRELQKVEGRQ